jgi:hypothetical protein
MRATNISQSMGQILESQCVLGEEHFRWAIIKFLFFAHAKILGNGKGRGNNITHAICSW